MPWYKCFYFIGMLLLSFPTHAVTNILTDKVRERTILVEIYESNKQENLPVVIINHGYTVKNTEYSFIANSLADLGYYVVSIQHDLKNDDPLPRAGNLFERRKPIWERGVQNVLFVINELKAQNLKLNLDKVILIGHSNGGDISMMFATMYPDIVSKIVSLDSLRYPFPSEGKISVLHFTAIDTKPDPGVMPAFGVDNISIKGAKHEDLCDRGGTEVKEEISKSIIQFLNR